MKTALSENFRQTCVSSLLLAAGVVASSAVLSAEEQTEAQVTIQAERPMSKVVRRTSSGLPVVLYQLRYHVSYSDLDLATSAGADTIKQRVRDAAKSACADLDRLYPPAQLDSSCIREAEDAAMSEVNKAIALAAAKTTEKAPCSHGMTPPCKRESSR